MEIVIRRALIPRPSSRDRFVERGKQRIEIGKRFAHAHHDDMAEPLVRLQQKLQPQHLFDDFAGGEVALQPIQAAGAEHATHAATDLRADANGAAGLVAQEHALDLSAICQRD